jgi:hypothetical protein
MQVTKPRPRTGRRLSYHAQNPHVIVGVDGRSQEARRFRDITDAIVSEYGAEIDPLMLRELAGLRLSQEVTATAIINGDRRARSDIVRITNLIARRERDLREAKRATPRELGTTEWSMKLVSSAQACC